MCRLSVSLLDSLFSCSLHVVCHGSDANEGGVGCLSCVYSPTESKVICDTQQCAERFAQHPTTKRCIGKSKGIEDESYVFIYKQYFYGALCIN